MSRSSSVKQPVSYSSVPPKRWQTMPKRFEYFYWTIIFLLCYKTDFLFHIKIKGKPNLVDINHLLLYPERLEFECWRLLLLQQSAAAGRRSNNPLHRAGTASDRICAAAGNDCVIYRKKHSTMHIHPEHADEPIKKLAKSSLSEV